MHCSWLADSPNTQNDSVPLRSAEGGGAKAGGGDLVRLFGEEGEVWQLGKLMQGDCVCLSRARGSQGKQQQLHGTEPWMVTVQIPPRELPAAGHLKPGWPQSRRPRSTHHTCACPSTHRARSDEYRMSSSQGNPHKRRAPPTCSRGEEGHPGAAPVLCAQPQLTLRVKRSQQPLSAAGKWEERRQGLARELE